MARIVGVDIPRNKKVPYSLCYIHGIGLTTAKQICLIAKIDFESRVQDLSEKQVVAIRNAISNLTSKVEGELRSEVAMNIKRLKDAGSYKGLRHRRGLPANGQRTKTNARTRKGKKRTIGLGKA
ncbi:MAG: 30S ribosomal protein S13 [Candidatus Marinimicrobia bacterium]|nr:30S ribosomal protein S13 [Candidatus Neomarinimicrobiota bacterium]|tara:strand:+ start:55 stop:426 length:372 start_codon:yes stop_codon:yes gene_type:complete